MGVRGGTYGGINYQRRPTLFAKKIQTIPVERAYAKKIPVKKKVPVHVISTRKRPVNKVLVKKIAAQKRPAKKTLFKKVKRARVKTVRDATMGTHTKASAMSVQSKKKIATVRTRPRPRRDPV